MNKYVTHLIRFLRDEDGPTAVEYAVMLALIIAVCLVGIGAAGTGVQESFMFSFNEMEEHINGGGSGSGATGGGATGGGG